MTDTKTYWVDWELNSGMGGTTMCEPITFPAVLSNEDFENVILRRRVQDLEGQGFGVEMLSYQADPSEVYCEVTYSEQEINEIRTEQTGCEEDVTS